jgi:hypothetical protein
MKETRTEPVKDANLPVQSVPTKENENISDFIHLLHSDDFSNENMKDVDNFIPELESLLQSLENETLAVNSENVLSICSDMTKLNDELSTDSDLGKLNSALSAVSDLKMLNNGLLIDSFAPQAEEKAENNITSEVQPKVLLADIKENKDHNFVTNDLCQSGSTDFSMKWSEVSSCLEDTVDRHVSVHNALPCGDSEDNGSSAVRPSLLDSCTSPAVKTTQCLNISQHAGDSEAIVSSDAAVHAGPETVIGGIPLQPVMKQKVKGDDISNLKVANLTLQEKPCGQPSHTEILHPMTNGNETTVENRTDNMASEVGMHGVTPFLLREMQDHTYSKVKHIYLDSASQEESFEFPSHDQAAHSFSVVGNSVTEKSTSDTAVEDSIPGLTTSTVSEVLVHSALKLNSQNATDQLSVGTDSPIIIDHSVPVTGDIHDLDHLTSDTDIGDLTCDILNIALSDIPVAQNVSIVSCDIESMATSSDTGTKEEVSCKSESYTTEKIFATMNNIANVSQMHLITDEGVEGTATVSNQALMLGIPLKEEKSACNVHMTHCKAYRLDSNVYALQKLTQTSTGRQIAVTERNSLGIDSPQLFTVGSYMVQVKTGNRTDLQKNGLCSQTRAQKKIMNDLKIDGFQYSSITNEKNNVELTNSERFNGSEIIITAEVNSKMPLSSEYSATAAQKRPKDDMTASQVEQNKCTEIPALPPGSVFQQKGSNLCSTQQNKLIAKETNIDESCNSLKSHISFAQIKREKFAGFTFEKPVMPQRIPGRFSTKGNCSKTELVSKGTKKYRRPNKALPSAGNHPAPDPSTQSTSNTTSSNQVSKLESQCNIKGNQVEKTNDLNYMSTYDKKKLDPEIPNWIEELLM